MLLQSAKSILHLQISKFGNSTLNPPHVEYLKEPGQSVLPREEPGLQDSSKHLTTQNASPAGLSLLKATHTAIQNSGKQQPLHSIKGHWEKI